jgi:hypothetical protein
MRLLPPRLRAVRRPLLARQRVCSTLTSGSSSQLRRRRWAPPAAAAAAAAAVALGASRQPQCQEADGAAQRQNDGGDLLGRWLRKRGATLGQVRFAATRASGDGAFAAADVKAGTSLLTLPPDSVLSAACACATADVGEALTALRERLRPSADEDNPATLDALLLSVMLIELRCRPQQQQQQQQGSSWQEWVATLPAPDAVDTPACWSDAQLASIGGTPVYGVASARRAWLDSITASLPPLLAEVGLSSAATAMGESEHWLRWADALVWSRAVCLPAHSAGEQGEELAMLPGENQQTSYAAVHSYTHAHAHCYRPAFLLYCINIALTGEGLCH